MNDLKLKPKQRLKYYWSNLRSYTPSTVRSLFSKRYTVSNGAGKRKISKQFVVVDWDDGKTTTTSVEWVEKHCREAQ